MAYTEEHERNSKDAMVGQLRSLFCQKIFWPNSAIPLSQHGSDGGTAPTININTFSEATYVRPRIDTSTSLLIAKNKRVRTTFYCGALPCTEANTPIRRCIAPPPTPGRFSMLDISTV